MKSAPAICASFTATSLSTSALMSCLRSLENSGIDFPSYDGSPTSRRSPARAWNSSLVAKLAALTTVQSFDSSFSISPTIWFSWVPMRSEALALFQPCSDPPKLLADTETTAIDLPLFCAASEPMVPAVATDDVATSNNKERYFDNWRIFGSLNCDGTNAAGSIGIPLPGKR